MFIFLQMHYLSKQDLFKKLKIILLGLCVPELLIVKILAEVLPTSPPWDMAIPCCSNVEIPVVDLLTVDEFEQRYFGPGLQWLKFNQLITYNLY